MNKSGSGVVAPINLHELFRKLVTRTYHLDGINPDGSGLAALAKVRGIIRW